MGVEIERKFLIKKMPENIDQYAYHLIEQAYLTVDPVIRVRRQDDEYYMTYKGSGLMERTEYNLPLTRESYEILASKAEGNVIRKKRYLIPLEGTKLTVELDEFAPPFSPLVLAEVEFESRQEAESFVMPDWFDRDVTDDKSYHNSNMSRQDFDN